MTCNSSDGLHFGVAVVLIRVWTCMGLTRETIFPEWYSGVVCCWPVTGRVTVTH